MGLSAAADCPFLPRDLVSRLHAALVPRTPNSPSRLGRSVASGDRTVERRPAQKLRHALVVEDIRKIDRWTARYRLATVTWPTTPLDPFFNANTMDDIAEAERLAALDDDIRLAANEQSPDASRWGLKTLRR